MPVLMATVVSIVAWTWRRPRWWRWPRWRWRPLNTEVVEIFIIEGNSKSSTKVIKLRWVGEEISSWSLTGWAWSWACIFKKLFLNSLVLRTAIIHQWNVVILKCTTSAWNANISGIRNWWQIKVKASPWTNYKLENEKCIKILKNASVNVKIQHFND